MKRICLYLVVIMVGCIEPYFPSELKSNEPILIVEGFLNTNGDSKIILARSRSIIDSLQPAFETGATVWIEDENGNTTTLTNTWNGNYILENISLTAPKYRLRITTPDQQQYASEFVPVLNAPEIDSVTWRATNNEKIEVLVSTHGEPTSSPYYQWTFEETWEYRSYLNSQYFFDTNSKSVIYSNQNNYTCWRSGLSSKINIESTNRFNQNRVSNLPLTSFGWNDERTTVKYSILVKQYSLTKDAFTYWQQLKQSNEDIGSIFGPLPSELKGNLKNLEDETKPIVGFFSIGNATQKRIFIPNSAFPPPSTFRITPYRECTYDTLFLSNIPEFSGPPSYLLGGELYDGDRLIGYSYSVAFCVDCRMSGGTNSKPSYWQ